MANKATLQPAKKGEVRNPNGRPKGSTNRKTIAKWVLSLSPGKVLPESVYDDLKTKYPDLDKMTVEEVMHLIQIRKSIDRGDTMAYSAVLDSAYGKAAQDITTDGESLNKGFIDFLKIVNQV